jgi:hypothetical protein
VPFQRAAFRDDRGTARVGPVAPGGVRAVDEEDVPRGRSLVVAEDVRDLPPELAVAVPVVLRACVHQKLGDLRVRVAGEHRDPTDVDAKIRVRVALEDVLLGPTGPSAAFVSGRRKEEDETGVPGVFVECASDLLDARDRREAA